MSHSFRNALMWALGSAIMAFAALTSLSAAYADGQYVPANPDAFYHARRILDAVMTGAPVIQFDARIHVPEGSWLTWPWGYDQLIASIVRLFGPFATEAEANRVLMNIPVAATPIAVAIVVLITRQLELTFAQSLLLVVAFAAYPLAFMPFAVGNIDHHYAELIWTLMTLAAGMAFFRENSRWPAAVLLGLVLGTGIAIHNGLFILLVPVALMLGLQWMRGRALPARWQIHLLAGVLVATSLLVCIPSEPWRRGFFEFYTLSWFHLYIAACVAAFAVLVAWVPRSRLAMVLVPLAAVAALIPIVGVLPMASDFVTGDMYVLSNISEVKSPYELWYRLGAPFSTYMYSWLMWIALPATLLNLWWVIRWTSPPLVFCALVGVLGLTLLQLQFRFGVFGLANLLITPLLALRALAVRRPHWSKALTAAAVVLFAAAYYPTQNIWTPRWMLGGSRSYGIIRGVFEPLRQACAKNPGVVLGEMDIGHWVRYHTACSVIGDAFLLTAQHQAKLLEGNALLAMTPQQFLAAPTRVDYILVHHGVWMPFILEPGKPESPNLQHYLADMSALERTLLGPYESLPKGFELMWEKRTPGGQIYARLFAVRRPP
jgi:hypothetical protein